MMDAYRAVAGGTGRQKGSDPESDGRVEWSGIFAGLAEKKRRRVAGNHSATDLSHDVLLKPPKL
jgi:hypothetical protein